MYSIAAKKQYRELTCVGSKFHNLNIVKEIFPEASVCEIEFSGVDENNKKQNLIEFIERYTSENLILLGDGGIGKTTMLFHILESYCNSSAKFQQIPLYIELNQCPTDLESWCLDDKKSVFIEKYIAGLIKDEKNIDKNDNLIKEIQHEFQKDPHEGEPQYLVLLDGLNEVASGNSSGYSVRTILENEIANALKKYRNVRFIVTSRNESEQLILIKKIKILGVSKECIEAYLRGEEKKRTVKAGITDQVMKNKSLLHCLRIPLFLNMFGVSSGDTVVTTRGEILRDFFYKKRSSLYSNKIEGNKNYGFVLDFIIPEIAWEMVINDTFTVSFTKVQEIIERVLKNKKESIALNEFSQKCFGLNESPSYICDLLLSIYSCDQRTKRILDIMIGILAIIYVDNGEYKFKHHHFRDYFASLHIINGMKLGIQVKIEGVLSEGTYLNDLKKYKLHKNIIEFISESIGLHHSNPKYVQERGWTMREWDQNNIIMLRLLDVFRERFNNDIGWALWNIVQIFNCSGMGLLGVDLSDLNLLKINFNGILCGIDTGLSEIATKFDNSLIDLDYFLPISHHEIITEVKYSNDGQYILTISNSQMILWNSNYDYVNRLNIEKHIKKAIFSNNSNYIVCCTKESTIVIWDLWKDTKYIVEDFRGEICDLCSGNSNNIYVAFKNGNIMTFQINSHQWYKRTYRLRKSIEQLLFNKKYGQIVVRTKEGNILCVEELNGNFIELPFLNVKFMCQSQEGTVFGIVTSDDCIKVGDLYEDKLTDISCNFKNVTRIQLSSDGKYLAITENGDILQILDLEDNEFKRPLQCALQITSLSFSTDNKYIITTAGEMFAKIWEIKSNVGICIRPLGDMADWIRNAYYSPNGNCIATSSVDSTGKIWNAKQGRIIKLLFGHQDRVTSIAYDHTGKKVVTTSDDYSAKLWDVRKACCLKTLINNENSVHNATFDKDDKRLVTVSWDMTGTIWNLEDGEELKRLIGHEAPILTVLFDRTHKKLITSSNDKTAIVWNAKTGEDTGIKVKHEDRLNSAAFSPDGKYLITSSFDRTARIWTSEGKHIRSLDKHSDSVRSALFSPDGNYIVTVSRDGTGKLWDGHTFEWCQDLIGHKFFVRSAMFDKTSKKVITASYDGSIREWNLEGRCTNVINSIPGLFICGCDFRNLHPKCSITPEQKKIFLTHGAFIK